MYVDQGINRAGVASEISAVSGSGMGRTVSGEFLRVLSKQMEGWVKTMSDNKITQKEISAISGMLSGASVSSEGAEEDQSATVYDGTAATLYATLKVNEVSNLMQWLISFAGQQRDLDNKMANILGA